MKIFLCCITDSSVHYFVVMVRNGAHVIFTEMVSTHDVMVRGTLEFPNLISFNNISQDFVIDVEVYGMVRFVNKFAFLLKSKKLNYLYILYECWPEKAVVD